MVMIVPQVNAPSVAQVSLQRQPQKIYFGQGRDTVEFSQEKKKPFWQEHPVTTTIVALGTIGVIAAVTHGKLWGKVEKEVEKNSNNTSSVSKVISEAEQKKLDEEAQKYFKEHLKYLGNDLDKAEKSINEAIKLSPKKGMFHCYKGFILEAKENPEAALKEYEESMKVDPGYYVGFFNAANLLKEKEPEKAFNYLQNALAINSEDKDVVHLDFILRGKLGIEQIKNHSNKIIDALNIQIEKNPKNYNLYIKRAIEREKIQDFEGSFNDYKKTLEFAPEKDKSNIYLNMAGIRGKYQGYLDEALEYSNKAIDLEPKNFMNYFVKALILNHFSPKKSEDAKKCLDRAIKLNDKHVESYVLMAEVLKDLGKKEEAEVNSKIAENLLKNNKK